MVTRLSSLAAAAAAVLLTGVSVVQAAPLLAVNYTSIYNGNEPGFTTVTTAGIFAIGSYAISSDGGQAYHSGDPGQSLPYLPNLYVGALFSSNNYDPGVPINVTISGFTPAAQYEVTAYTYTWDGVPTTVKYFDTGSPATTLGTISYDPAVYPTAANPDSATFNMTTDAGGSLHMTCAVVTGGTNAVGTRISGFTVSEVPEPASIALLGLGSLALLRRKRQARA